MLPDNRNKKGTGFTNLSRILQASRGARLGGQVASGVSQTGQQVRSQIDKAREQFQTKAQEEAKKFGTEAAKERESTIESIAPVSGTQGVQPQQDQADLIGRFADWRSAEYKGPKGLEDYGSLSGKVTEAEELGRLGKTSGGKQELLRRFVGGRDYSQGEQRLDAALLGLTGQRDLAQAQRETRGLSSELAKQTGLASEQAQQLAKQAKSFGEETLGLLGKKKEDILKLPEYGVGGKSFQELYQQAGEFEKNRENFLKSLQNELQTSDWAKKDINQKRDYFLNKIKENSQYFNPKEVESITNNLMPNLNLFNQLGSDIERTKSYLSSLPNEDLAKTFFPNQLQDVKSKDQYLDTLSKVANLQNYDFGNVISELSTAAPAKNLTLQGVTSAQSPEQAERLRLLDVLAGKTGTDVEFRPEIGKYEKGELTTGINQLTEGLPETKLNFAKTLQATSLKPYEKKIEDINNSITQLKYESKLNGYSAREKEDMKKQITNLQNQLNLETNNLNTQRTRLQQLVDQSQAEMDAFNAARDAELRKV